MFIFDIVEGNEELIKDCVTRLWDAGIEVSHTVREYSDIEKFLHSDLHAFTQFVETRFIQGSAKIYNEWNKKIFKPLNEEHKKELILEFFEDVRMRYQKFGDSAKALEPNVKYTAGALRDLQVIEWIYSIKNNLFLSCQEEITQTEVFLNEMKNNKILVPRAVARLQESYKFILSTRNHLHLLSGHKNDRLEFVYQEKIANVIGFSSNGWHQYMHKYFESSNIIKRFCGTMMKRFEDEISEPVSDYLAIELDDDFTLKKGVISLTSKTKLNLSSILRAFYYRCINDARFDEYLRANIIETIIDHEETQSLEHQSSVFFREILNLPKNVGKTLEVMNELGVLSAFMPEFKDLVGFFQPGVYHCYTADEHTLIALKNLENLSFENSQLGKMFRSLNRKDILYLAVLFHDIAKPQTKKFVEGTGWTFHGHEELGARMMKPLFKKLKLPMHKLEYVEKLVRLHLRPIALAGEEVTDSAIRRLIVSAGEDLEDLITLCRADITSKNPRKKSKYLENYERVMKKVWEVEEKDKLRAFQSPVRGEVIMKVCNLKPSKKVGEIKKAIEEAILDGKIGNNYEEAFQYLLEIKDEFLKKG